MERIAQICVDDIQELFPVLRHAKQHAVNEHDTGAGEIDHVGHCEAQHVDRVLHYALYVLVALLLGGYDILHGGRFPLAETAEQLRLAAIHRLFTSIDDCHVTGVRLQTPAVAAAAEQAVGLHDHVPDLSGPHNGTDDVVGVQKQRAGDAP